MVVEPQPPHRLLGTPGHSLQDLRLQLAVRGGVRQRPAELQVQPLVLIVPDSRQYTWLRVLLMDTHGSLNKRLYYSIFFADGRRLCSTGQKIISFGRRPAPNPNRRVWCCQSLQATSCTSHRCAVGHSRSRWTRCQPVCINLISGETS